MFRKFAYFSSVGYTVKINWLSQMHVYLTNILLVETTKHLLVIPAKGFECFDQIKLAKANASETTNVKLAIFTNFFTVYLIEICNINILIDLHELLEL